MVFLGRFKFIILFIGQPADPERDQEVSDTGIKLVSRALCQMEEKGIVECKNPDAKRGRIYGLTDIGRRVLRDC